MIHETKINAMFSLLFSFRNMIKSSRIIYFANLFVHFYKKFSYNYHTLTNFFTLNVNEHQNK
jgi:hypothetical protein